MRRAVPEGWEPPDGGFGWVVVFACTVLNVLQAESFADFGLFLIEYTEYFNTTIEMVSWVGAFQLASCGLMSMIWAPLVHKYGCRPILIAGSFLISVSYIISSFMPNIKIMYLTYGILPGAGFGTFLLCPPIQTQLYFKHRRSLAVGIIMMGLSVGGLVWPPVAQLLIDTYGWRGTLQIQAAIHLNGLVIAALLRTPKVNNSPITRFVKCRSSDRELIPIKSRNGDLPPEQGMKSNDVTENCDLIPYEQSSVADGDTENCDLIPLEQTNIVEDTTEKTERSEIANKKENPNEDEDIFRQLPESSNLETAVSDSSSKREKKVDLEKCDNGTENMEADALEQKADSAQIDPSNTDAGRHVTSCDNQDRQLDKAVTNHDQTIELTDLTNHNPDDSKEDVTEVSQMLTQDEATSENPRKDRPLLAMLALFRRPTFMLFCVAFFFVQQGNIGPFTFLPLRGVGLGASRQKASFLTSIAAGCSSIARVGFGFLGDVFPKRRLLMYCISAGVAGTITIISATFQSFILIAVYSGVFASIGGCYVAMQFTIPVDLVGIENVAPATGILIVFIGLAYLFSYPLSGFLLDKTGGPDKPFFMLGCLQIFGCFLSFILLLIRRHQKKKLKTQQATESGEAAA